MDTIWIFFVLLESSHPEGMCDDDPEKLTITFSDAERVSSDFEGIVNYPESAARLRFALLPNKRDTTKAQRMENWPNIAEIFFFGGQHQKEATNSTRKREQQSAAAL